jgi:O-antigen ligase
MLQWFGHFSFGGDVGVRPGVLHTTEGTGQLQGGEFAYPVAVALFFAVLAAGNVRSTLLRILFVIGLALNAAACLVTFERSFWSAALLGMAVVFLATPGHARIRIALLGLVAGVIGLGALAFLSPTQFKTAKQRAFSVNALGEDQSVRYRLVESRFVLDRIHAHPVTGSGLGAEIFWGRPWQQVTPKSYAFSHNGYLWLAWKTGVPTAALLVLLLLSAVLLRAPPGDDRLTRAIRNGSRGGLAGLLLASVTFSTFNELPITSAIGVILALAVCPVPARVTASGPSVARVIPRTRSPRARLAPAGGPPAAGG